MVLGRRLWAAVMVWICLVSIGRLVVWVMLFSAWWGLRWVWVMVLGATLDLRFRGCRVS